MKKIIALFVNFFYGSIQTFEAFLEAIQKEELESVTITARNTCLYPPFNPLKGTVTYDLSMVAVTTKGRAINFIDTSFSLWSDIGSRREKINEEKIIALAKDYATKIEEVTRGISVMIYHEEKPIKVEFVHFAA